VLQLKQVHAEQIQARTKRQRHRAEIAAHKVYGEVRRMLATGSRRRRRFAGALLVTLVEQSSSPGQPAKPQLYPRLHIRNHNRFNVTSERNLRRLLRTAAQLARRRGRYRRVARKMVESARPQRYSALVPFMRARRRLGDRDGARWAALRAILAFGPADQLVLDPEARVSRIGRGQVATITEVLRTARGRRAVNLAFQDLRREDTLYFGKTAALRLQAIAYLARGVRGWTGKRLVRELKLWEPETGISLKSGLGDRWIPARYTARKSARGFGYLVAATLLARRR
jgi:hypothetical protein